MHSFEEFPFKVFSLKDERTWGGGETYVFMSK
jgi:hypothetical protein